MNLSGGNLHYFWGLEGGNPNVITSFPASSSVSGYRQVAPSPQIQNTEQVGDDYIVVNPHPNYQSAARSKNKGERATYFQANKPRSLRLYQLNAIRSLQASIKEGKDRFLFEMATGAGKALTAAAVIRLFLRPRNEGRVLFLVDWREAEDQAKLAYATLLKNGEFAAIKSQVCPNSYRLSASWELNKPGAVGLRATAGRYGGTYARRDIAFEFGMWISPEFRPYQSASPDRNGSSSSKDKICSSTKSH